ncbi:MULTISPECIES: hypothetical protein [Paracoccus]|jgi:hypothetical protein|uniref:Uncharacterized protein n=1 Tax=Paracoccus versutus TaxID=34007 RepID=A0A3E0BYR7_PARVE|nr:MULTISPECIES: hypothetical protein [Paracoccus]SFX78757.1 hypothetical protein SAMN04244548_01914 [Paracoccus pantotrophus]MBT0778407.1 hypothetical protein [Paracoccus sp. pheM1]MCJ1902376.1 hypothetical protein [Paracoccus versutus]MDF3905721.1 hypothetical protein [Paracoccus sp. AS002]REF70323.1 hypothetical protein BDD41_3051 [Paracoccus versutus]
MARTSNRRVNRRKITQRQQDRRRLAIMFLNKQIEASAAAGREGKAASAS